MDGSKPQTSVVHLPHKTLSITEIIGILTGSTVIGTVLFSIVGYIFARSYFGELGAPWAADLLSTSSLVALSAPIGAMFVIAIGTGAAIQETLKNSRVLLIVGLIAVIVFWGVSLTSYVYRGAIASTVFLLMFLLMYGIVVGCITAHAKHKMREGQPIFANHIRDYVAFGILVSITIASSLTAQSVARVHSDPIHSTLPTAHIFEQPATEWRLVKAIGDKALLLKLTESQSEREFRVVPIETISTNAKRPS